MAELYRNEVYNFQEGGFGLGTETLAPNSDDTIQCFFETKAELETLLTALKQTLPQNSKYDQSEIVDTDWKEKWKEYSHPVEISPRLIVHSSWHSIEDKANQQSIVVDPEMAFGTGSHPTTKMCLKLIDSLYEDIKSSPKSVLDVGCGSGILSVAADLFGATEVLGVDINEEAILVSAANASKNKAWNCQFGQTDLAEVSGKFDLVIANILSGTLKTLWPEIVSHTKEGGSIILSGLLEEEKDSFFDSIGADVQTLLCDENWIAAHLHR
ncbi:UNVERIFIED_CONTAM: hypothetical protein GTU68_031659 [Idotea baltica]|nr:hypothetical protein [Idotea baltica]